jgi:hypothetical protein
MKCHVTISIYRQKYFVLIIVNLIAVETYNEQREERCTERAITHIKHSR